MTQSLKVNEKDYVPSSELAKKFDYTSDYISKLARDEKILGTRVGRQWFIEPESLRTYIQQLEVEKRIHKETLSRQRKLERKAPAGEPVGKVEDVQQGVVAAGQALVVLACGVLVGVMSLSVYSFGLKPADFASGFSHVASEFTEPLTQGFSTIVELASGKPTPLASPFATVETSVVVLVGVGPQFEFGAYTVFPVSVRAASSTLASAEPEVQGAAKQIQLPFSDEVLLHEVDGEIQVQPVFRDSAGEFYELSVVPVVNDVQN